MARKMPTSIGQKTASVIAAMKRSSHVGAGVLNRGVQQSKLPARPGSNQKRQDGERADTAQKHPETEPTNLSRPDSLLLLLTPGTYHPFDILRKAQEFPF